jgi:GT2 family glycosyltransferase
MAQTPKISILTAADDHPPDLDRLFDGLISQTLQPHDYEAVIIDSTHMDDYVPAYERALERKPKALRLVYRRIEKGGRALAYNRGLEMVHAPLVLFIGDDNLPGPRTVETHLRFHQDNPHSHMIGISSSILPKKFRTHFSDWLEKSGELYGVPFFEDMTSIREDFFYIGNSSVKRSFLDQAGPFDERFPYHAWDDFEYGVRLKALGMKARFLPEARAEHYHDISIAERCRLTVQAGESAALFEQKHPGPYRWSRKIRKPPIYYELMHAAVFMLHALSRREDMLIARYRAKLNAAFVSGYRSRAGSRRLRPAGISAS